MNWIYKTIDFIEDNLSNKLSIEELAKESGYSVRHFQRLFKEITGDSVAEYVRGRRLTAAMQEISSTDKPIIDIAFDFQFESQQSFTRAFQSRFAFPPRRFRNNRVFNPPSAKQRLKKDYIEMLSRNELTLEPEIVDRPEKYFIGAWLRGDLNSFDDTSIFPKVSELTKEFNSKIMDVDVSSIVNTNPPSLLIVTFRVPINERVDGDGIIVMVAAELKSPVIPPEGMRVITVQNSRYARFTYTGEIQNFNLASYYVAGGWFPRSKYWVGNAPLFNYMQIKGLNSKINKSVYYLPLRTRNDRFVDKWWEH